MSITNFITVPGDDDVQLKDLTNWALTISWCSKAIIDVFYDTSIQNTAITTLTLDRGELCTPENASASTTYEYHTEILPLVSGIDTISKATFAIDAVPYGLAHITAETTMNSGVNWYKWYDNLESGTGVDYPDGFLNRSKLEKIDGDDFVGGQNAGIRIKITTDGNGFGGHINYVALLTDPDLFNI